MAGPAHLLLSYHHSGQREVSRSPIWPPLPKSRAQVRKKGKKEKNKNKELGSLGRDVIIQLFLLPFCKVSIIQCQWQSFGPRKVKQFTCSFQVFISLNSHIYFYLNIAN